MPKGYSNNPGGRPVRSEVTIYAAELGLSRKQVITLGGVEHLKSLSPEILQIYVNRCKKASAKAKARVARTGYPVRKA